eukprot:9911289-Ditylum_brightwellii.AAC.1
MGTPEEQRLRTRQNVSQTCDVYPFYAKYESIQNVPVIQAVTAYDDSNENTHLLVINEAFFFGDEMNDTLINPNQIHMYGHMVNDDSFDSIQPFRISHKDGLFILFEMKGTNVHFETRVPTNEEPEICPYIVLTDDTYE